MKTYSHEHEAKIAHCVRTHKRFPLFFASKSCFFDLNQNTCFSSTQTGCRTTADCLKRPERPRNMPHTPQHARTETGRRQPALELKAGGRTWKKPRPATHAHACRPGAHTALKGTKRLSRSGISGA